jgi:hypothetical protein
MRFAEPIERAPKDGECIILQDAGSVELGRWAQEANGWVQHDGTPVGFSPTHWKRLLDAPRPDDEAEPTQKQPIARLGLALVAAIVCMGGIVFWIESEDSSSSNSVANLERKFTQERDRASVAIAGFTAAREPENVSLTKQRELKQALDESEARSKALARELAETKQHADARQIELQEALGSSENTVLALERELSSAREAVASAEGSSNAKVTTRDTTSPTGSLNRPMEGSNAVSEITGSMPTPQDRGNVTAGVQTSSDATLDNVAAGASGRLTRSNRPQPGRPQPPPAMSSAEEAKLVARAQFLIKQFDFAGARLLLAYALETGSARAAFMMAETYDWQILRSLQAYGVRGDAQRAREFYQMAAAVGIEKARERAEALQSDANLDTRVGGEDRSR